jgi:hypothetical protein
VKKKLPYKKNSRSNLDLKIKKKSRLIAAVLYNFFVRQDVRHAQTRIRVRKAVVIGFLIQKEDVVLTSADLDDVAYILVVLGCGKEITQASLQQACKFYQYFKRFANVVAGNLAVDDVNIPLQLTKAHLLLIITHCGKDEASQDRIFYEISARSLNALRLKFHLLSKPGFEQVKAGAIVLEGLVIRHRYNLACLKSNLEKSKTNLEKSVAANTTAFTAEVLPKN